MKFYKWPLVHEILVIFSLSLTNSFGFFCLGLLNKILLQGKIKILFCTYPVNAKYLSLMTRPIYVRLFPWRVGIIGFFKLHGVYGITMIVAANEENMIDENQWPRMEKYEKDLRKWAKLLGALKPVHGGRLPALLYKSGINKTDRSEANTSAELCCLAVQALIHKNKLPTDCSIALIGSSGYVGARANKILSLNGRQVITLDPVEENFLKNFDEFITKKHTTIIILNLSKNGVLTDYAPHFLKGIYVIDDVFPEADSLTIEVIKKTGAKYFHIAGVKGFAFPSLEGAYQGALPFCAIPEKFILTGQVSKNDIFLKEYL